MGSAIGYYRLLLFGLLYGQCDWILKIVVDLVIIQAMGLATIYCCCLGYCTGNAIRYYRLLLFCYYMGNVS